MKQVPNTCLSVVSSTKCIYWNLSQRWRRKIGGRVDWEVVLRSGRKHTSLLKMVAPLRGAQPIATPVEN
jgi:hypothetical protein